MGSRVLIVEGVGGERMLLLISLFPPVSPQADSGTQIRLPTRER